MGQLGLVIRGDRVEYLYAELGTIVFAQRGGDFLAWAESTGIRMETIETVIVQKDFCQEILDTIDPIEFSGTELEFLRQRQLESFEQADQMTPDTELIRNQAMRENYWALNVTLGDRAKGFVEKLKGELAKRNCKAPIYFLRGSGFLTDEKNAMKNPVLTWRSGQALELMSAGTHHNLEDYIYVKRYGDEVSLEVVKSGEPVMYQNHCSFKGYELPPWFVKVTKAKVSDWEDALTYLIRIHGDLPVICQGNLRTRQIQYLRYLADRNPYGALFQTPYRKRIFRQVIMDQETSLEGAEADLRQKMAYYLSKNNINLKDATQTLNREILQYSLDRIVRLELRVVGLAKGGV
jgi:hypothetical protein